MKLEKKSVYELVPSAERLFSGLSAQITRSPFFPFWEYLEKAGEAGKSLKGGIITGKTEEGAVVEGALVLGEGSVIKAGSRIEGTVFIGRNCVIGPNAYIRGTTFIADNCHIGISEIKNSVILRNSNVPHFSYVGDSVIGESVNLGAGTKVANLRFDNANVNVELDGKKADSGRRKLGVLIGHNTKTGINCSLNCGIIIGNNCLISPGITADRNLRNNETLK
jgi:bifunctional UDP-N-acetylglucosamine pyrophosphorylase/glucosamine-1-phosphate N-acetyltransferase